MSEIPDIEYFADLILPVPLDQFFTYKIPPHLFNSCSEGKRAVVQFGKKKIYSAIIYKIHQNKPNQHETKEIIEIIDDLAIVTTTQFKFWEWMWDYYMCTPGEVYRAAIPSGLRLESSTSVSYNYACFENDLAYEITLSTKENQVLDALRDGKPMNLDEINKILSIKNCMPIVKSLYEKGTIKIDEGLVKGYTPKTEKYILLSKEYQNEENLNQLFEKLKRAPRQYELVNAFLNLHGFDNEEFTKSVALKTLVINSGIPQHIVGELLKKGIFELQLKNISRFYHDEHEQESHQFQLEDFQEIAYNQILEQLKERQTVLLHGVTSSGKTEIYIKLISRYLEEGKQVLYLLPEIALTTQIIERLQRAFGKKVGVFHSKYSDAERVETYNNILGKEMNDKSVPYQIILGVRSAVFLPFQNLGLIIVDEEHESSYKQYNPAPRYQARDSAIMLALQSKAKVLLGSATPSIESYFNAKTGKFGFVTLNKRFRDIAMPEIIISDVSEARRKRQMKSHFTPVMLNAMQLALDQDEQIILFQNRRGYALYVECHTCGWIPRCKYCDVSLTYHKHTNQLVCHYCGFAHSIFSKCDNCHSTDIRTRGFGTEKVEDELNVYFPDVVVKRLDLDSAKGKHAYSNIIGDFEQGKIDILIGTQMVTKGLDFDNVSLVGVLDANQMLNFPDFRAYERSYQLMAQVGGRAGRKNKQGKVVIQTVSPQNIIIKQVATNDYVTMFLMQANERKTFKYPPFNRLININLKHKDKNLLDRFAATFGLSLRQINQVEIIGPEYPIIGKIYDVYIKNILVKLPRTSNIAQIKHEIRLKSQELIQDESFKGTQVVFDVDPY